MSSKDDQQNIRNWAFSIIGYLGKLDYPNQKYRYRLECAKEVFTEIISLCDIAIESLNREIEKRSREG